MKGISILTLDMPDYGSCFKPFFEPIFTCLEDYYWCRVLDGLNYNIPTDWYDDEEEEKDNPILKEMFDGPFLMKIPDNEDWDTVPLDTSYIRKFSDYFRDDWDRFYLIRRDSNRSIIKEVLELVREDIYFDRIDTLVQDGIIEHILYNHDGAYWEIYSHNTNLIDLTKDHILKNIHTKFILKDFLGLKKMLEGHQGFVYG